MRVGKEEVVHSVGVAKSHETGLTTRVVQQLRLYISNVEDARRRRKAQDRLAVIEWNFRTLAGCRTVCSQEFRDRFALLETQTQTILHAYYVEQLDSTVVCNRYDLTQGEFSILKQSA